MSAGKRIRLRSAAVLWSLGVATVLPLPAENGALDPVFAKVHFDRWLAAGPQSQIPWKTTVSPARLGIHQRLLSNVEIEMDGGEMAKRLGKGELVMFVQFKDAAGDLYQGHSTMDLMSLEEGVKNSEITYRWTAFLLPGDYRISVAALVTGTEERSVKETDLHVPPLKNDPLPEAWKDLPPVELLTAVGPPDSWYLPLVTDKLYLPLKTRRPLRVEMIVNLTPSERASGSQRMTNRNLGVLIPAMKTIAQADFSNAALNVTALDLSRRRITYHQEKVGALDWPEMRDALSEAAPGTIDLKSLGERKNSAAFFAKEVSRRLGDGRAIVILSGPVTFESGEDLHPIEDVTPPGCRVFYIRYHPAPLVSMQPVAERGSGRAMRRPGWNGPMRPVREVQLDQLEPTLKPLAPRLFDVETPEQFRKALATIFAEISEL
jgi:hypothetical protein